MAIKAEDEAEAAKFAVKEPVEEKKVEQETVQDKTIGHKTLQDSRRAFNEAEKQAREEERMMEDVDALLEVVVGGNLWIEKEPTKPAKLPG